MAVTVPCHRKDWNNHLQGHRQWALTKQKVCGTVLGDGGEPRGHETVPGEGGAYWSLCVPMGRARSGLQGAASGTTLDLDFR